MTGAVAIIPARGGSKRLPRKNVADFLGRPIIAYTIDAAKESNCFDRIVVSTDDREIAEIGNRCGAEIEHRDQALATDAATLVQVCQAFLERELAAGRNWSQLACLYATAPLRTASDISATMNLLEPGVCDFAMGVSAYEYPAHSAMKLLAGGAMVPMWPELINLRASELAPLRANNGTTDVVNTEAFLEARTFYGPGLRGYDMPRWRAIDIDTAEDLKFARWLAQHSRDRQLS